MPDACKARLPVRVIRIDIAMSALSSAIHHSGHYHGGNESAEGDITMAAAVRAALYLRVSTGRQADNDLSIPDQRRQAKAYCASRGWEIAADYVEPGLSATDDRRPEFQRMIDAATTAAGVRCYPGPQLQPLLPRPVSSRVLRPP